MYIKIMKKIHVLSKLIASPVLAGIAVTAPLAAIDSHKAPNSAKPVVKLNKFMAGSNINVSGVPTPTQDQVNEIAKLLDTAFDSATLSTKFNTALNTNKDQSQTINYGKVINDALAKATAAEKKIASYLNLNASVAADSGTVSPSDLNQFLQLNVNDGTVDFAPENIFLSDLSNQTFKIDLSLSYHNLSASITSAQLKGFEFFNNPTFSKSSSSAPGKQFLTGTGYNTISFAHSETSQGVFSWKKTSRISNTGRISTIGKIQYYNPKTGTFKDLNLVDGDSKNIKTISISNNYIFAAGEDNSNDAANISIYKYSLSNFNSASTNEIDFGSAITLSTANATLLKTNIEGEASFDDAHIEGSQIINIGSKEVFIVGIKNTQDPIFDTRFITAASDTPTGANISVLKAARNDPTAEDIPLSAWSVLKKIGNNGYRYLNNWLALPPTEDSANPGNYKGVIYFGVFDGNTDSTKYVAFGTSISFNGNAIEFSQRQTSVEAPDAAGMDQWAARAIDNPMASIASVSYGNNFLYKVSSTEGTQGEINTYTMLKTYARTASVIEPKDLFGDDYIQGQDLNTRWNAKTITSIAIPASPSVIDNGTGYAIATIGSEAADQLVRFNYTGLTNRDTSATIIGNIESSRELTNFNFQDSSGTTNKANLVAVFENGNDFYGAINLVNSSDTSTMYYYDYKTT